MVKTTASIPAILRDALVRIKPASDELHGAKAFVAALNKLLAAKKIKASAFVGGSGAKGTHLRGDHDVDIFVRFDFAVYKTKSEKLSDLLAAALPKAAERIHGSRDYFQLLRGEYIFEIVPVLKVTKSEQAQNVMDVSPLHVDYVTRRIKSKSGFADEIRLAKQFCKAAKVYGAESYINGFSGHVLDLLVLEYGSFLGLLKAAAKWKERIILDPAKHHRNPQFSLNSSKRRGPMILVDPIQPERNAAAALSRETYIKFKVAAASFLKKPSPSFFIITPLSPEIVKENYLGKKMLLKENLLSKGKQKVRTVLFIFEGTPLDGKDDIVATKLLKVHEYLVARIGCNDFTVLSQGWDYDRKRRKSIGFIVVKDETLPATKEHQGPPLVMKKECGWFKEEHPDAKPKGGKLVAKVVRKYRKPVQLIAAALKESFVNDRARNIVFLH